jgi:hypothetical protein
MTKKRDEMHPLGRTPLAKQTLADLYGSVYRQFGSVSHFDMYSMRLVDLFPAPSGELVLAPDPWWPSFLCACTALFDLVQCYEAAVALHGAKEVSALDALFTEWETSSSRLTGLTRRRPSLRNKLPLSSSPHSVVCGS